MFKSWKPLLLALCASGALTGCVGSDSLTRPMALAFSDPTSLPVTKAAPSLSVAPSQSHTSQQQPVTGDYVIEFRARIGPDFIGHSYIAFGRVDSDGSIADSIQAGLYPSEVSGFAFGITGTESTTEPVALDSAVTPHITYRRKLTQEQFKQLSAAVAKARADPPTWSWTGYNCNTFAADMAREAGMKTPAGGTWMAPVLFVAQLRDLNERR